MTRWRTALRWGRLPIAAILVAIAASAVASMAVADNVQNDVATTVDGKIVTITAGGAGAMVKYGIQPTPAASCDAADGSAVTVTPTNLPSGVTKSPGSVTFTTCPDPSSGLGITFTASASAALGDRSIGATAVDTNGSYNTSPASFTLRVVAPADSSAPVIVPQVSGTAGNGTPPWYRSDVTVTWSVTDAQSAITSKSPACDATTSITADTSGTTVTCTATSAGGTASESVTIRRDATAPTLSPSVSPNPVAAGGSATASPNATDALSGLASSSCDPVDTSSVGEKTVSCTATDNAGNVATASASYTVFDPTPPVIAPQVSGTEGNGTPPWYTSDVDVTWSVTDPESAITSSSGCAATTIDSDTAGVTLTCTATSAGGTASESVTVRRDATAPTLAPTVSPNPVLLNGTATASANASDTMSGLASSSCGTVDTSSVGLKSVTCTATDNAGNTAIVSASYTVAFNFAGFFQPVDNLPTLNTIKAGSSVPVKFSLGGNQGLSIMASGSPTSKTIACDTAAPGDDVEQTVNAGGSSLSYDSVAGQYVYVWKTEKGWTGTCRQLNVKLADGTSHLANFKLK